MSSQYSASLESWWFSLASAISFIWDTVMTWWAIPVPGLGGVTVGALHFAALSIPVMILLVYKVVRGL